MGRRSARGPTSRRPSARRRNARNRLARTTEARLRSASALQQETIGLSALDCGSRAEDQLAAGRRVDHAVWHLRPCLEQEVQAAAMHGNQHVRLKLLDL